MLVTSLIILTVLFISSSLYELLMLQQNSYNENKKFYHFILEDIKKNYKVYLIKYLLGLSLLIGNAFDKTIFIIFIIVLLILILFSIDNFRKHNQKLPLKFTKRMIRIICLDYLIYFIFVVLICRLQINLVNGLILLFIAFNNYILILDVFLLKPIEKMIFNKYKRQALDKLNKMPDLKVIGITGSFGKTSTKMILQSILKEKYKGFYTPASFNTPNGITMTINNEKTIFNEYFICEMGAKNIGEIKELCDLVHPKYGIITSIGAAHLESFKTLENIQKTKFELYESINDGIIVLNKDDSLEVKYPKNKKTKIIWIGINNKADVMADNIKMSDTGTSFDIIFNNTKEKIKVNTILLGIKNVYNILSAVALSKEMDVSNKQIIKGVKNIEAISHRLELKKNGNIVIIDDAFNSNPEGAKTAVEVLNLMKGKKVIITPGMVEMGKEEDKLNFEFGKQIASICDKVYLIGPKHTKPIYDGLIENKYNKENIFIYKSFNEAYNALIKENNNQKVTILIENDLPDSYMEV